MLRITIPLHYLMRRCAAGASRTLFQADASQFYDMQKYDIRMNLIRSGQSAALDVDAYDPLADMKAHNSTIKVSRSSTILSQRA